jgi:hypothetical protein
MWPFSYLGKIPFVFSFRACHGDPCRDRSPSTFCFCLCCETFPRFSRVSIYHPIPAQPVIVAGLYEDSDFHICRPCRLAWLDLQASTRLFIAKPWSLSTPCYITYIPTPCGVRPTCPVRASVLEASGLTGLPSGLIKTYWGARYPQPVVMLQASRVDRILHTVTFIGRRETCRSLRAVDVGCGMR